MQLSHPMRIRPRQAQGMLVLLLLSSSLLLSACGSNPQVRQEADAAQTRFMQILQYAQQIGVPATSLREIFQQQEQLLTSDAPLSIFGLFSADDYYHNLATRYTQLTNQIQELITTSTAQAQEQTQQDLQTLQHALQLGQSQHFPVQILSEELTQALAALPQARDPYDYKVINGKLHAILQSLNMMENLSSSLTNLDQTINLLQQANLDVSGFRMSYQNDERALGQEATLADFGSLQTLVGAQTQHALTNMTQAIPNLVAAKISAFSQQLQLMQDEGVDPKLYQSYQLKLQQDRALVHDHMNVQDYETFAAQIDKDTTAATFDQLHIQAQNQIQEFHHEAQAWNNTHLYYDSYNGEAYPLNAGYLDQGIGSELDAELVQASSVDDMKNVIDDTSNTQFNLQMLESDYQDSTPYYQVHRTDIQALNHYQLQQGQVIVVSMVEQALRLYQDGQLVRAFHVTTGRYELPSLPGLWSILDRESPTTFRSSDPPSSPYWYPPTHINYAILYHYGGYFIHDSWWRATYGPGTQFPHADASGNQAFAGNGSHGCVNVQEGEAAWLYNNTSWGTAILVY